MKWHGIGGGWELKPVHTVGAATLVRKFTALVLPTHKQVSYLLLNLKSELSALDPEKKKKKVLHSITV